MINFNTYLMLYTLYLPIYFLVNFLNVEILVNHSFFISYYLLLIIAVIAFIIISLNNLN